MYRIERPQWFFMWTSGRPYITTICGWYRKQVIREALQTQGGLTWKQVYARGGRAIKCDIRMLP